MNTMSASVELSGVVPTAEPPPATLLQVENDPAKAGREGAERGTSDKKQAPAALPSASPVPNGSARTATRSSEGRAPGSEADEPGAVPSSSSSSSPPRTSAEIKTMKRTSTMEQVLTYHRRFTVRQLGWASACIIWITIITNSLDERKAWMITPPLSLTQHDYLRGQMIALFGFLFTSIGMAVTGKRCYEEYMRLVVVEKKEQEPVLSRAADKAEQREEVHQEVLLEDVDASSLMQRSAAAKGADLALASPTAIHASSISIKLGMSGEADGDKCAGAGGDDEKITSMIASTAIPPTRTGSICSTTSSSAEASALSAASSGRPRTESRAAELDADGTMLTGSVTGGEDLVIRVPEQNNATPPSPATSSKAVAPDCDEAAGAGVDEVPPTSPTTLENGYAAPAARERLEPALSSCGGKIEDEKHLMSDENKIRIIFGCYVLSTPFLFGIAFIVDSHSNEVEGEFLPVDRPAHQWMSRTFFFLQMIHHVGILLWTTRDHDRTFVPVYRKLARQEVAAERKARRRRDDHPADVEVADSTSPAGPAGGPRQAQVDQEQEEQQRFDAIVKQQTVLYRLRWLAIVLMLYGAIIGFFVLQWALCKGGCSLTATRNFTGTNQYLCIMGTVLFAMTHAYDRILRNA